jgi:hypothetical protein
MRPPARLPVVLLATLLLPGAATASHNGAPRLDHYVVLGEGSLIANPGGHEVTWERCLPETAACAPYDDGDGNPQRLLIGDPTPGTTFRATQDGVTLSSEAWRGPVRAVNPPRVEGEIRVGGYVRPVAADWEGGWGRERDWLQLQACRTDAHADCKVILDSIKFGRCPPGYGGRLLPGRYEGWWLRVADSRIDRSQPFTREAYAVPEGIRPLPPAPGIAVATVGRIAPGQAPAVDCGRPPLSAEPPAPTAVLRRVIRRAERGRLVAARVTCPARCTVELIIRQRRRSVSVRRTLARGTTRVAVTRAAARRLRAGSIRVRVSVDGRVVAAGRSVLHLR